MGHQDFHLIEAYSDDKEPILDLADKGFYVEDGKVMPYKKSDQQGMPTFLVYLSEVFYLLTLND